MSGMNHVVQFSTGAGSAEVALRVHDALSPADRLFLLTADTMAEDPDNWRFARQIVALMPRAEWTVLRDGRTPMEVGRDQRVVPNNRLAVCSRILKREILRRHIDATFDPSDSVMYLGFDWTEEHRMAAAVAPWAPYEVRAPLMDPPFLTKSQIIDRHRTLGIEPCRLYEQGFSHANCGGACVRGGQAQWELLLRVNPERFAAWEDEEQQTRSMLAKDVAILRDRRGGESRPLTLRSFRERLAAEPALFDADEWGACGCTDEAPVSALSSAGGATT